MRPSNLFFNIYNSLISVVGDCATVGNISCEQNCTDLKEAKTYFCSCKQGFRINPKDKKSCMGKNKKLTTQGRIILKNACKMIYFQFKIQCAKYRFILTKDV